MKTGARVFQVNVGQGGVPKLAITETRVGEMGLEGDQVAHRRVHGGPDRAVCLFALERILALHEEGHGVFPGAFGENVTTVGLPWDDVVPGDRLFIGDEIELEITQYTKPCKHAARFVGGDVKRIHQPHSPGYSRLYARVLRGGVLRPGMDIVHVSTTPPQ